MEQRKRSMELAGRTLTLESGLMAKQSSGSVTLTYGDTVVLVAANAAQEPREGIDFFPLSVEYRERAYAGGKIPGGFFKREGRPSEKEILACRQTDRPIRPLFPDGFLCETQVMISLLSTDQENPADILGTIGASVALMISDIPWNGPVASVRVGIIDGKPVLNPTRTQLESSTLDLILTGNGESIIMIEGEGKKVSEEQIVTAIEYGREAVKDIAKFQMEFIEGLEVKKRPAEVPEIDADLAAEIEKRTDGKIDKLVSITDKSERRSALASFTDKVIDDLEERFPEQSGTVKSLISKKFKETIRKRIVENGLRIDGRDMNKVRPVSIQLGILPRTHGSALFTRGDTQSLATVTLGSKADEQFVDDIDGEFKKKYMLHYNFPPYSVGEVRRYLGVSRREVGHGNLAERALKYVMPSFEDFPYTVRVVSDILESNGSSSMASVCAGSLALMDAGVPLEDAVAGISIGMVNQDGKTVLMTDILGDEDHFGDMDFKVAGTRKGITSLQVDLKIGGISLDLIRSAIERAREGRLHILDIMEEHIEKPRESLSPYAPRILHMAIDPAKIGELIGPGGRNIRSIIRETECAIDVDDDGMVVISSPSPENCDKAKKMVESLVTDPEVGMVFEGEVKRITNFGAFVEFSPGKDGLLHISEISHSRTEKVEDELSVGDKIKVKVIKTDDYGKFDVSLKALIERPKGLDAHSHGRREGQSFSRSPRPQSGRKHSSNKPRRESGPDDRRRS
ncbi:MAG: polyribonucleotide nucleotidyltransferase [Candidatus Neomarinimicrobiota bacterium]